MIQFSLAIFLQGELHQLKPRNARDENIRELFTNKTVVLLTELKAASQTTSRMTIHRALTRLAALTSYSHRGAYYTLPHSPVFDEHGLWACQDVMFSKFGDLLDTTLAMIDASPAGYLTAELDRLVRVESKHALLQLFRRGRVTRMAQGRQFVYLSKQPAVHRRQQLMRTASMAHADLGHGLEQPMLPEELRAGIIRFFSLLNEKQRRLYAGLEAAKLGYGGATKIAAFFGINVHTVGVGRRELFQDTLDPTAIRHPGGGRHRVEKKPRA